MICTRMLMRTILLCGIGLAAAAEPASSQVACPAGYYYSPLYGCVPAGEAMPLNETLPRQGYTDPLRAIHPDRPHAGYPGGPLPHANPASHAMPGISLAGHTGGGGFHGGAFFGGSFGHGIR